MAKHILPCSVFLVNLLHMLQPYCQVIQIALCISFCQFHGRWWRYLCHLPFCGRWCQGYILVQSCSSKWFGQMNLGSHLTNKGFNLFCCVLFTPQCDCLHHNRDTCSSPCWILSYLIMHLCIFMGWLSMRLRLAIDHPALIPKFKSFLVMEALAMFAAAQHRPVQEPYRVVLPPKAKLWAEKLWAAPENCEHGCIGCLDNIFVKISAWRIANSFCTSFWITWIF